MATDGSRADGGRRAPGGFAAACAAASSFGHSSAAAAADLSSLSLDAIYENQGLAGLLVFLALVLLTSVTALLHLTGRARWMRREAALSAELQDARAQLDRAHVFLSAEPQIVVAWGGASGEPDITGDLSLVTDAPAPRRVLGFGAWLAPDMALRLETLVEALRLRGEAFRASFVSLTGRHLDIEGRPVGGRAIMRIRDVSGDRLELSRLRERHAATLAEMAALRGAANLLPSPAWLRDAQGRLVWVNAAYARAVEAADADDAVTRQLELFERPAREAAAQARRLGEAWRERAPAVVAGARHTLDATEATFGDFAAGFGLDRTEIEQVRAHLGQQMESHARTLDQLSTAVAIFDRGKRLVFHNAAYRRLWGLDAAFLGQSPTDGELLDHLRAARQLPEQADFRAWKAGLMAAYHSVETAESAWYLPDGRTLRVVVSPNPQGGVTYLFDDESQRRQLEAQYYGLVRVQGETLDSLREGVALFGTDGRLKLSNPAMAQLWRLEPATLAKGPHVDEVRRLCAALLPEDADWDGIRALVAGLQYARTGFTRRLTLVDGRVIDCNAAPLPDGATLLTFTDSTDGVRAQEALARSNAALLAAGRLRNDFVHHVSYELRSPLTHIIGFSQILGEGTIGPLNDKQREYAGHIRKSSEALYAIINDILDLATIDADAMKLEQGEVDIRTAMEAAAAGVQDRLEERDIRLQIVADPAIGSFVADGARLRQALFNLLSNAIGFSEAGQTVSLAALRRPGEVVFKVSDQGRGIPPEILDRVFERFESHTVGSRHRGAGLGLAIVRSFVELHGGRVFIDSAPGAGTTVTCVFPDATAAPTAAETMNARPQTRSEDGPA